VSGENGGYAPLPEAHKAPDYQETARRAIKEMHRQVGPLVTDEQDCVSREVSASVRDS